MYPPRATSENTYVAGVAWNPPGFDPCDCASTHYFILLTTESNPFPKHHHFSHSYYMVTPSLLLLLPRMGKSTLRRSVNQRIRMMSSPSPFTRSSVGNDDDNNDMNMNEFPRTRHTPKDKTIKSQPPLSSVVPGTTLNATDYSRRIAPAPTPFRRRCRLSWKNVLVDISQR